MEQEILPSFFEERQHMWFYSALSFGLLNFQPGKGEVLHVGNGPYVCPMSGLDSQQPPSVPNAQSSSSATQPAATSQLAVAFPVQLVQHTKLATSRSMDTSVTIYGDGSLYAVTSVHNGVWLTGYHGQASVSIVDTNGVEQIRYPSPAIGVTGTGFGHPEAVASWQVVVPDNIRNNMRGIAIYQNWLPDFDTIPRDSKQWVDLISKLIQWIPGLKAL